jgi:hypothetical protein
MEYKTIVCNGNKIWLGEDGILRSIVMEDRKGEIFPKTRESIRGIKELTEGKKRPILADLRTMKTFDRKNHNCSLFSFDDQAVSAMAMIITSPQSRKMGTFFLGPKRPHFPVRPFFDEEKATVWLRKFL